MFEVLNLYVPVLGSYLVLALSCLCNALTVAEVLVLTVMLGFSHRTVLFGTDMLETNTAAITVLSSSI